MKIAVSGKLGSGKNLFLEIARYLNKDVLIEEGKFAQKIYDCTWAVHKTLGHNPYKDGKLLQFIGEHYREIFGKTFWIDRLFNEQPLDYHIITDMRFPEELAAAKKKGYTTVRIHRKEEWRLEHKGNREVNHISETALDKTPDGEFDYIINNNGSLVLFESAVAEVVKEVRRKRGKA